MNADHVSDLLIQMSYSSVFKYMPIRLVKKELKRFHLLSERKRKLPAESIVYLVIMLAIYAEVSINENLRKMLAPIRRRLGIDNSKVPVSSAVVKARKRLGFEPLKRLFELICKTSDSNDIKDCYWKSYLKVAVDGTKRDVQNTKENFDYFGSSSNQHGTVKQAKLKAVALMQCTAKFFFAVGVGSYKTSEQALFRRIMNKLDKTMLLFADRIYFNYKLWQESSERAGALIWRMKAGNRVKRIQTLPDGSYLAEFRPSPKIREKYPETQGTKFIARIIEFYAVFRDGTKSEKIRLVTTILSETEATAQEIAEVYPERWLIEEGFSELNARLGSKDKILRSQLPELVLQEFYGFMIAHYIVRLMMLESAKINKLSPNELSFTHSLNVIKRNIAFFPCTE
jgi:hypothetical protein